LSEETTSESVAKGRTYGAFRCLNCFERVTVPTRTKTHKCPHCGFEWRISWIAPDFPRIRGPVWDVNRRLAEEATAKEKDGRE